MSAIIVFHTYYYAILSGVENTDFLVDTPTLKKTVAHLNLAVEAFFVIG